MPDFQTERKEADWWFENQDAISVAYLEEQGQEFLELLIDKDDALIGKQKAAARGMAYKAYMVELIHRAFREQNAD